MEHSYDPVNSINGGADKLDEKRWKQLSDASGNKMVKDKINCIYATNTGNKLELKPGCPIWWLCSMGDATKSAELFLYGNKYTDNKGTRVPDLGVFDLYSSGVATQSDLMENFVHVKTFANPEGNGLGLSAINN